MAEETDILDIKLDELGGTRIAGRFQLSRMLGKGGYGAVYAAEQVSVRRPCAVKVLVPHVAANPRNTQRFEREARLTSQLVHPNTVVIYDFGLEEERKLLFLAMEYIEGESLREVIRTQGTLPLADVLHITSQIAGSLQDAHDRGLVHRDVKPHNVMITARAGDPNFVKVIDFGIAKFLDSDDVRSTALLTMTGTIVGTPAYMAPEQVRNGVVDGRTDQYALAICVYQMLTGRTVFKGETPVDIAMNHLIQAPLPLRAFNPSLPISATFENVLLRALSKEPGDRYDSIAEFADELERASGVSMPSAFRSSERERVNRAIAEVPTQSLVLDEVDPLAQTATTTEPQSARSEKPGGVEGDAAPTDSLPPTDSIATQPAELLPVPGAKTDEVTPVPQPEATPLPLPAIAADDEPGFTRRLPAPTAPGAVTENEQSEARTRRDQAPATEHDAPPRSRKATALALVAVVSLVAVVAAVAFGSDEPVAPPAAKAAPEAVAAPDEAPAPTPTAATTPDEARVEEPPVETEPAANEPVLTEPAASEPTAKEPVAKQPAPKEPVQAKPADDPVEPEPEAPHAAPASVTVTLLPWGELYVDGRRVGDSAQTRLTLSPGEHRLELRQRGERRASKTINVRSGADLEVELRAR